MRRVMILVWIAWSLSVSAVDWIRAGINTNALVWGRAGGLIFALPPSGFHPPEPRGLIRLGYPVLTNSGYDLINFIAIEPVVKGRKGFSELERSQLDGRPGKQFTIVALQASPGTTNQAMSGEISIVAPGIEQLTVKIRVERFENGAEVILELQQRSDAPDEITVSAWAAPGSARMDFCILTATMGNRTRARELWLRDKTVSSRELYPEYTGPDFAPHTIYPGNRLLTWANGDALVAVTGDEADPSAVLAFADRPDHFWNYKGSPVTQYWKKPGEAQVAADGVRVPKELTVVVNARYMYWGSRQRIPHGISFENFELREPFRNGQRFTFGITRRTPRELGFVRK